MTYRSLIFIIILFVFVSIKFYLKNQKLWRRIILLNNRSFFEYIQQIRYINKSMKLVLTLLIVTLFSSVTAINYDTSVNYISNPDFSIPKIESGALYVKTAGAWSEVNNQIEIGKASLYNSRWDPNTQVCELAADTNSNVYQSINLDAGYYQLKITWAPKHNFDFKTSQWSVYWNDVLVKYFTPVDYDIHKQTLIVKAVQGANKLSLRGEGPNDNIAAGIKLVELYGQVKPVLSYDTSVNYISNPDFSVPKLTTDVVFVKTAGAWSEVNNQIEIGKASLYNSRWDPNTQICELAADTNSNVYQLINLDAGYYQLKITWAPKHVHDFKTSQWSVYWNDVLVKYFTPVDYDIHKQTLIVKAVQGANKLSLRGEGTNDVVGAGIKLVELFAQVNKPVLSYDTSVNYISNPDFSVPKLTTDVVFVKTAGAWSEVNNQIEIGKASLYNSRWDPNTQICELAADTNSNVYQLINLDAGYYQLKITWAPKHVHDFKTSQWSVYWNDVLVKYFTPVDYDIHKQTLIVKAVQGANKLSLRGEGTNDVVGAGIKLVELFAQVNKPVLSYDTSVNYISNPDFSVPKLATDVLYMKTAGAWSEVNNQIEIGKGSLYNSKWDPNTQICELAADTNSNLYQLINLDAGYYQLKITWAPKHNHDFKTSQWSVYWNDVLVKYFTPVDYDIHKQTLIVKAVQGANKLSLRGEGTNDVVGAGIKLVELFAQVNKPVLSYDTSVNYISNPDFSIPKLTTDVLYMKTAGAWSEVNNQIEIGKGSLYNSKWDPNTQICELAADTNSNLYQLINLDAGYYQLKITWAPKQKFDFKTSQWSVYWNDVLVKYFTPVDYDIHKQTLIVKAVQGANKLSLRGEGTNDVVGAGIKLVELFAQVNKPVLSYDTSVNYISNPDFSIPKLTTDVLYMKTAGAWSEVNNQIEIGKGSLYNSKWDPNTQICELAADTNSNVYQLINLDAGYYQLKITWAPKHVHDFKTSQWSVYWNDVLVKYFTPVDYDIHKQTLIVKAVQGTNKLSLRGEGTNDVVGAGIKLVELFAQVNKPVLSYDTSVNYISNPDFSIPKLTTDVLYMKTAGGWSEVNNQIEIGKGSLYNSKWDPNTQICELAADTNSNLYQLINLDAGYYQLKITWAPKHNHDFKTSQWSVYWNDVLVKYFTPVDYDIHKQTLIVKAVQGANKLSLRGEGTNDVVGAGIKLVELFAQVNKPVLSYDTSVNYISNPDFNVPKLATDSLYMKTAGAWSEVNNQIEIGKGSLYNSKWDPNTQICELAADTNSNLYQLINLDAGYYQLKITWAPKHNHDFKTSQWSVYWNDVLVKYFTPVDYDIHKQTLIVKAVQGANKLSLRGEGTNDVVGAGIKLVELFAQVNKPVLSYDTSVNYISNPDFNVPKLATDSLYMKTAGAWSEVNNQIEIGKGSLYNSKWDPNTQICELAADTNSNLYQLINLDAGYYQLKITWAPKHNHDFKTSQWSVYWNDVLVKYFTPVDYDIHKQTLIVKAVQGANKLSLRGEGTNDVVGAGIKLVELFAQVNKPVLSYDTSVNYISNPDFSIPKLTTDVLYMKTAGAWSEVNNQIEIGKGSLYNSKWDPNTQICELAADTNSNLYQLINLDAGYYQLKITWAPKQKFDFKTSQWSVYWNDVLVKYFTPVDYDIHKQTLIVKAVQGANKLSLRGEGTNDVVGAGLTFVGLYAQKNNIQNGGFQTPHLRGAWQTSQSLGQWSSNTNQIEIGAGHMYNPIWKTGQIAQLDANQNSQIHQAVSIPAGKYNLRFDWAARSGIPLPSNAFSVWWNGDKLTLTTATDYLLHTFTTEVLANPKGSNVLSLRGEGISDGYGICIDNVRLQRAV